MNVRNQQLTQLRTQSFDLLVIGGGATGLGTALDAISRGYSVALIEQADFAKGTSSKSTKLVHGGVRYLEQMNFKLVREALLERQYFYQNAPHIAEKMAFFIPCYDYFSIPFFFTGLKLYDGLAGFPKEQCSSIVSRTSALQQFPGLNAHGLKGGIEYFDGQFNDAQMAVILARTIHEKGGTILNYCRFEQFIKTGQKITGAIVKDVLTGESHEVNANCVVNATGVFSDQIRAIDEGIDPHSLTLAQGIHLVAKNRHQITKAILIPKTSDGRVLFIVPWQGVLLLGTTDTKIPTPVLEATAQAQEIQFILDGVRQYWPDFSDDDLLGQFAGIRPLAKEGDKQSKKTSREEKIHICPHSTLVSIVGGKWTTYRYMGEKIVNTLLASQLLPTALPSTTQSLKLTGWAEDHILKDIPTVFKHYGAQYLELTKSPDFATYLHADLPYREAEIRWAIEHSFAQTVDDILARRTRAFYINPRAAFEIAPKVAQLMAAILGRNQAWIDTQLSEVEALKPYYLLDSTV